MVKTKEKDARFDSVDKRLFKGKLKEKLKSQAFRRKVVKRGVFVPLLFGYVLMGAAWAFMAPNPETEIEKLMQAFFWVAIVGLGLVSNVLDAIVNSISPKVGELYDERQNMEYLQARSDALRINGFLFFAMTVAGFVILIMNVSGVLSFTHPNYSGIHYYIGLAGATLVGAKLAPGMLLAWRLPDESNDGEGDDDDQ